MTTAATNNQTTNSPMARTSPSSSCSDDGLTARTVITRLSGGLNGDGFEVRLRKVGDEWFVVDLELVFLS